MHAPLREIVITSAALEPPPPRFERGSGAIVEFYGVVRAEEGAETLSGIDYEAHAEMARHQCELLLQETAERFAIHDFLLHHRIGFVPTAVPSLFLRVSATHRGPAFAAAEWFIAELKQRVPIWKHPVAQNTGHEVPTAAV